MKKANKVPAILVVGSVAMDVTFTTDVFPEEGETVIGTGSLLSPGGKGANQAVQAARLGCRTDFIGKIGDDAFGGILESSLNSDGVGTQYLFRSETVSTGTANIIVENNGGKISNRIIVSRGANGELTPDDVSFVDGIISDYDFVLLQMEIPPETNRAVIASAKRSGVPVMLNPAPFDAASFGILSECDLISPNEHEASLAVGFKVNNPESVLKASEVLMSRGAGKVIITLGDKGASYYDGDRFFISPAFTDVTAVDPTAAGDSFVSAFCVASTRGASPEEAMRFANRVSSLTVSSRGAQKSLPYLKDI